MKPEYKANLENNIADQKMKLSSYEKGSLNACIAARLNVRPIPKSLPDQLNELSSRIEFIERMPRIIETINASRSGKKPTKPECDTVYEQVEKQLQRLEKLIKRLDGTEDGENISTRVLYEWSPEANLIPHIEEFRKQIATRKTYDAEKRKNGRPFEVWQVLLCEDLERAYRMIFDSKREEDIYTIDSLFTHILQTLLHRIEKGSGYQPSDIRKKIYSKKNVLDSPESSGN